MRNCLLLIVFSCVHLVTFSQPNTYLFNRNDSIPVTVNSASLRFPWGGGLNYSQHSNIDLNFDGVNDLFVFDRTGNKVLTFIQNGSTGISDFKYAPEYQQYFPQMSNWSLLVDYNCDNLPDIFTSTPGGIRIFKNTSDSTNGISFVMVESLLYSYYYNGMVNLYVSSTDIPAITDIDYDGDIDILTFGLVGSRLEYHKNYSIENGYNCDSLQYQLKNECWGYFTESPLNNQLTLFDTCSAVITNPELTDPNDAMITSNGNTSGFHYQTNFTEGARHSGSCLVAFDNNGVNSKDLIIGDISAKNLVYGENGGSGPNLSTALTLQDSAFPSYNIPAVMKTMACPFIVDVNNDNINDLIVTPQATVISENAKSVAYYQNLATNVNPDFNYQTSNFIQFDMIDRGEGALPVLFDYDGDGLKDLVISNYGYFIAASDTYLSKLGVYKNTGTATNPAFELVQEDLENLAVTMNDNSLHPSFGDLDNDGDEDMIVGNYTGTLYYFENIAGAGNIADFVLSQANIMDNTSTIIDIGQYSTPLLIDLDRDGDNDLIIGERNGNLNYYENIGTPSAFSFRFKTDTLGGLKVNQAGYVTGYSVPDIYDDNGKYQLIIGSQTGYVHHYDSIENNILGSYRKVDTTLLGFPDGIRSGVAVGDLNNDGLMDIITGNYRGGVSFYKGDTQGTIGINELSSDDLTIYPNPATQTISVSFNSGREMNLLVYDITGKLILSKSFINYTTLDVSNFINGLYLLKISDDKNQVIRKFIKQ